MDLAVAFQAFQSLNCGSRNAFQGCKAMVKIMNDHDRSRVSCELLKKNKEGEKLFLNSGWCDLEQEAEHKVFREAAEQYHLLDKQVRFTEMIQPQTWVSDILLLAETSWEWGPFGIYIIIVILVSDGR